MEKQNEMYQAYHGGGFRGKALVLAERYRNDASFQAQVDAGDLSEALKHLGIAGDLPADVDIRMVFDTGDTMHFVLPTPGLFQAMRDESLSGVAGGAARCAGTAGCGGTASSFLCSCLASTVGSAASASTAGTASSGSGDQG
ncbi:MAG: hypothetical protein OXU34_04805 [Gammaproteobacteria bacterium]|nr:hypothetical protein [Gammaproteobacteria bacterium]